MTIGTPDGSQRFYLLALWAGEEPLVAAVGAVAAVEYLCAAPAGRHGVWCFGRNTQALERVINTQSGALPRPQVRFVSSVKAIAVVVGVLHVSYVNPPDHRLPLVACVGALELLELGSEDGELVLGGLRLHLERPFAAL